MTQETALSILTSGTNVFLTGEPGSGKTHTVNRYVAWLKSRGIAPAITAATGIAATHIGGMTIHSWSGIGVRKNLSPHDLQLIASHGRTAKRVRNAHVLIIDEVSMLSRDTLTMVDMVCRELRNKHLPFGGLQVLLVGDFFQLPPIMPRTENTSFTETATSPEIPQARLGFGERDTTETRAPFAFRSPAWEKANLAVCYLSEQHRQEDEKFLKLLSIIRSGTTDPQVHQTLTIRRTDETRAPHDLPRLYAHNADVDRVNSKRLSAIKGAPQEFTMLSRGPEVLTATLKRGCLSPEVLSLKIGARVMFTKNNPDGSFVNGTLGEVEKFADDGNPIIRTLHGRRIFTEPMEWVVEDGAHVLARIIQIPLRLAWAITIHKSQGMTLDAAVMDLSQAFEYGQGYVALSRVRSLAGLHLLGWNDRALEVHPEISAVDENFKTSSDSIQKVFEAMPAEEHAARVKNFITICGGTLNGTSELPTEKYTPRGSSLETTFTLLKAGMPIEKIAKSRGLAVSTIFSHIIKLYASKRIDITDVQYLASPALTRALPKIHAVFHELGTEHLTSVFEKLGGVYSYNDLRLARMLIKK